MRALAFAVATLVGISAASAQAPMPTIMIDKPTVIAFFQLSTVTDPNNDGGQNEALSDFNFYAATSGPRLKKAGIDFQSTDRSSFHIRIGTRVRTFRSGPVEVGYYLIAPGKEPHIEYGVMTDDDLAQVAAHYFGVAIPQEQPRRP